MATTGLQHTSDGTDQGFMADVVEASMTQPVIVDFWAPWCGPCRTLGPVLERVVEGRKGAVKLVKINTEQHNAYATQLGVRSIPAVYAFHKGRPVDGFMGALPESQVSAFIERLLGGTDTAQVIAEALARAEAASQAGDIAIAAEIYAGVIEEDPENATAIAGLARCYLANGDTERALAALEMVPPARKNESVVKSVRLAIEMAAEAPAPTELDAALSGVSANPGDHARRYGLAEQFAAAGRYKDAADHLLIILTARLGWEDGKAKTKLLQVFEAAGPADPVTIEGRRRLASLMFA